MFMVVDRSKWNAFFRYGLTLLMLLLAQANAFCDNENVHKAETGKSGVDVAKKRINKGLDMAKKTTDVVCDGVKETKVYYQATKETVGEIKDNTKKAYKDLEIDKAIDKFKRGTKKAYKKLDMDKKIDKLQEKMREEQ